MNVQGSNPVDGKELFAKVQDLEKGKEAEKKAGAQKTNGEKDKISLSGQAKEISELKSEIDKLPDIRTERVEEVKKAIDTGNYNIDTLRIAEKILEEI